MFVTERLLLCQVMTPLQACSAFVGLYPWFPGVSSRPPLAICFFLLSLYFCGLPGCRQTSTSHCLRVILPL